MLQAQPDANHDDHLRHAALQSKDRFLAITSFLLSRPDLTTALVSLFVVDGWAEAALRNTPADSFNIMSLPKFYTGIYRDLKRVVGAATMLTSLWLSYIDIDTELLSSISTIETLSTVGFAGCRIHADACDMIQWNRIQPQGTVLNLSLTFPDDDELIWYTLLLYPHLLTLSVHGWAETPDVAFMPPRVVMERCNPFKTLQRASFDNFQPDDIPLLASWMSQAAASTTPPNLKLTHFKIRTPNGTEDSLIINLLHCLRLSPKLRILVLDGLQDGSLNLIDSIAEACPNICGLTLMRRHNVRQIESNLASWPHTSA
jgi:hypothetical protein